MAAEREQVVGLPSDEVFMVGERLPEEVMRSEYSVAWELISDGPRSDRGEELHDAAVGSDDFGEPCSALIGLWP